jgi:glycosyltransferase involved in cell wall biosynthesis
MASAVTLSIVMPAWNEEAVIRAAVEELDREILSRIDDGELTVVDDHSSDRTGEILDALAEQNRRIRVVRSRRNYGHGPSVVRGLDMSRGDWLFQVDADREIPVGEFWKLWTRAEDADLVLGVRVERNAPFHRVVLSRLLSVLVSLLARRRVRDPNVPFRLFRRTLWEALRPLIGSDAAVPSVLVSLGAARSGRRVIEVPVAHVPAQHRQSSLRAARLTTFSLRALVEVLRFYVRLRRRGSPRA